MTKYIDYRNYVNDDSLPLFYAGGGGIYAHPTTYRQFSPDVLIRGGSKYTLNLGFAITEHIKLVPGQKKFSTARGSPPKSDWQLIFCSVFTSKLVVFLLSMK